MKPGAMPRFVTASLKVDYLSPTPVGKELELRAKVEEISVGVIQRIAFIALNQTEWLKKAILY